MGVITNVLCKNRNIQRKRRPKVSNRRTCIPDIGGIRILYFLDFFLPADHSLAADHIPNLSQSQRISFNLQRGMNQLDSVILSQMRFCFKIAGCCYTAYFFQKQTIHRIIFYSLLQRAVYILPNKYLHHLAYYLPLLYEYYRKIYFPRQRK